MQILDIKTIKSTLNLEKNLSTLLNTQRKAFIDFSNKRIETPPPLQMHFPNEGGECHIKAGFNLSGEIFTIKTSTGFYNNYKLNLPPGDGVTLVFSKKTGILQTILIDNGYLTTLRTALAALIAIELTPWDIQSIGIIGTGQVAQQLIELLPSTTPLNLWGRSIEKAKTIIQSYPRVDLKNSIEQLCDHSDIIITATASTEHFIFPSYVHSKTHIISLGADDAGKKEIAPELFSQASTVIVDSKKQALRFGDASYALAKNLVQLNEISELGELIENPKLSEGLIITDLTGIAAQDLAMATFLVTCKSKTSSMP